MNDMPTEDEIFEDLPLKLRKQVMAHWAGETPAEEAPTFVGGEQKLTLGHMAGSLIIGVPIALIGLLLICTILLAPIGFALFFLGAYFPYKALQSFSRAEVTSG